MGFLYLRYGIVHFFKNTFCLYIKSQDSLITLDLYKFILYDVI